MDISKIDFNKEAKEFRTALLKAVELVNFHASEEDPVYVLALNRALINWQFDNLGTDELFLMAEALEDSIDSDEKLADIYHTLMSFGVCLANLEHEEEAVDAKADQN